MNSSYLSKRIRILAADDEQAILESYNNILTPPEAADETTTRMHELAETLFQTAVTKTNQPSFELVACRQGAEAVDAVKTSLASNDPFAVAFLDVRMPPGIDGVTTAEQIRMLDPNIHIVIVTGFSDINPLETSGRVPPVDKLLYVQKPFHQKEIWQYASALAAKWQTERELKKYQHHLEDLVAARTAELAHAKQAAEKACEAKTEFMANISDEIRIPVNAIIGLSSVLASENLSDEQQSSVDTIQRSAENVLRIVNDILDFSKINSGNFKMDITDCSLEHLLAVVESSMRLQAKEKNIKFEICPQTSLPPQIRTDPVRLRQCLTSLISYTIKSVDKGFVTLNVSLLACGTKSFIRFEIQDTSTGLPADRRQIIFEKYLHADENAALKYGDSEFSLAVTGQLIRLLGGQLSLKINGVKDSAFALTVPVGPDCDCHNHSSHPATAKR